MSRTKRFLIALIVWTWASSAFAAVGFTSTTNTTPTTGSSFTYTSFAISGSNPVVVVLVGLDDSSATVSSVACSAGLTCGTAVDVKSIRNSPTFVDAWCLPAPSGTGTITVTLSASVPYQSFVILMSGADQSTPCASGDAQTATAQSNANGGSPVTLTVTPLNLTANDASAGLIGNTLASNPNGWTSVQDYTDNTTGINIVGGHTLGSGAAQGGNDGSGGTAPLAAVGIRVKAAGGGPTCHGTLALVGVTSCG